MANQRASIFLAHSGNRGGRFEPNAEHLRAVGNRAAEFASALDAADQANAMGLLHDLGKYSERFLRRVTGQSQGRAGDHALAGAYVALRRYKARGCFPAAAILGHHGGLRLPEWNWHSFARQLERTLVEHPDHVTDPDIQGLLNRLAHDGLELPEVANGLAPSDEYASDDMLDTRLLFSALVDADFLETEAHFAGDSLMPRRYRPRGPSLNCQTAMEAVDRHIKTLQPEQADRMQSIREQLREACLRAALCDPGLFTLSAPTGSGKTLAMLAFALKHAAAHGMRRIILVMPFLNIIDQTADLYRGLFSADAGFPEHYVLEDHSLASVLETEKPCEESSSENARRLLAENWDAPIVLTTTVRCLESLMSNRTSECRKLHRMAKSVLLFDEVQTLPRDLVVATLAALSRLSQRFRSTVLFATATQPAFEHLDGVVHKITRGGWKPSCGVSPEAETDMFAALAGRTSVRWELDTDLTVAELATRLRNETAHQWLCIVNIKQDAQNLFDQLADHAPRGLFHLSTAMCPMHRQYVLSQIRRRLEAKEPVRLVSTQCVEAGVDVDFEVVYRVVGPLEAVAQAAGRCNRHGRRPQPGRVHVVSLVGENGKKRYPPGAYAAASQLTETFVNQQLQQGMAAEALVHDPKIISRYYRRLYELTGTGRGMDGRERELQSAMRNADFPEVARLYRLIDAKTINILVPYDQEEFDQLREEILSHEPRGTGELRHWIGKARALTVSHYYKSDWNDPIFQHLEGAYFAKHARPDSRADWFIALDSLEYHKSVGLLTPSEHVLVL